MERDADKDLELCEAATPGPWETIKDRDGYITIRDGRGCVVCDLHMDRDELAAMIAASRDGWPWWIRRAVDLAAEVERLRALLEGDCPKLVRYDEDGLVVEHWAARALAASFADTLGDAPNYVQLEVTHPEQGPLEVTIRRRGGLTPEQMEVERLRAEAGALDRLRAWAARYAGRVYLLNEEELCLGHLVLGDYEYPVAVDARQVAFAQLVDAALARWAELYDQ